MISNGFWGFIAACHPEGFLLSTYCSCMCFETASLLNVSLLFFVQCFALWELTSHDAILKNGQPRPLPVPYEKRHKRQLLQLISWFNEPKIWQGGPVLFLWAWNTYNHLHGVPCINVLDGAHSVMETSPRLDISDAASGTYLSIRALFGAGY